MRKPFLLCCSYFICSTSIGQYINRTNTIVESPTISAIGAEYKYHPGENIIGLRYDAFHNRDNWNLEIAFDFGSGNNAHEKGFGILAGYRYAFQSSSTGTFFGGARVAIWFNKITSSDSKSTPVGTVVLQPGLETGYQFAFATHGYFTPAVSYDYGFSIKGDQNNSMNDKGKPFIAVSTGYKF